MVSVVTSFLFCNSDSKEAAQPQRYRRSSLSHTQAKASSASTATSQMPELDDQWRVSIVRFFFMSKDFAGSGYQLCMPLFPDSI